MKALPLISAALFFAACNHYADNGQTASAVKSESTVATSSVSDCIFGDHLVQMARMRDLVASEALSLTPSSQLSDTQKKHIVDGLIVNEVLTPPGSLEQAFEAISDDGFWVHTVKDTAHSKDYTLYLYDAGDNIHGFIWSMGIDSRIVAQVGDGSIYGCKVEFNNYDSLPWFYTN